MNAVVERLKPKKEEKKLAVSAKGTPANSKSKASIDKHLKKVQTFEASQFQRIKLSEKRAWRVAMAAILVALLSWIAIVFMLPLREVEAYVIRVDDTTGAVDVLTTSNEAFISNNEALDNYWISKFINAYESYDYFTIQSDYDTVGALTTQAVGKVYESRWVGPEALHLKYQDKKRVRIEIESMIPTSDFIRTVRFTRITESFKPGVRPIEEKLVALIGYSYEKTLKMTPAQRLVNPIGFYVRSYRVDAEIN